jgi:hypothetical protein
MWSRWRIGASQKGSRQRHRGGDLLADPPRGQQSTHAGQIETQGAGNAQTSGAVEGRDAAGQPDLVADPAPDRGGIEPVVGDLLLNLGRGERAAQLFERGDPVDPNGVGAWRGVDGERAEASRHRGHLGHDGIHRPACLVRSHVRIVACPTDNSTRSPHGRRA